MTATQTLTKSRLVDRVEPDPKVATLKAKIDALRHELAGFEAALEEHYLSLAPFREGAVVRHKNGNIFKVVRVVLYENGDVRSYLCVKWGRAGWAKLKRKLYPNVDKLEPCEPPSLPFSMSDNPESQTSGAWP